LGAHRNYKFTVATLVSTLLERERNDLAQCQKTSRHRRALKDNNGLQNAVATLEGFYNGQIMSLKTGTDISRADLWALAGLVSGLVSARFPSGAGAACRGERGPSLPAG
jgi:hypothetical protein